MLVAVRRHRPEVVLAPLQTDFSILDVSAHAVEGSPLAAPPVLHQREAGIHRTADGGGAGDAAEHILGRLLSQMVDEENGNAVGVGQPLEDGQVTVVVGVGGVVDGADHLEGVDNDQHGVRVFRKEILQLFLQSPAQESGLGGEVDGGRRVLRNVQQPVLDAELGVLQAEIEGGALPDGHPPDRLSLGHRHCQPQRQPGLAHLGRPSQDVEPLREQSVHDEGEGNEGLAHETGTVYGVQPLLVVGHIAFFLSEFHCD